MRAQAPPSKTGTPEMAVPVLPRSTRKPPKRFQKLLDEFNQSTGESLLIYWNPRAVPKISSTVNLDGNYTTQGYEGRWEIWRPVSERMPLEAFTMLQPVIIDGVGPAVKIKTLQSNERQINMIGPHGSQTVMTVGDVRDPTEYDIKRLRWCDAYQRRPGAVVKELIDDHNVETEEEAQSVMDDLVEDMVSYYWSKGNGIYAVNWDSKGPAAPTQEAQ